MGDLVDAKPKPRTYFEKIGDKEWEFEESLLDVHEDVVLWPRNPRLQTRLPVTGAHTEAELEAALQTTASYDILKTSIDNLGQMEPIYAWRPNENSKFLVIEGATRVAILRQLDRKYTSGLKEGTFRRVRTKILPPTFGDKERAILLARIHVRGSSVRSWGRYIEARFVYENVVGTASAPALMNQAQMAVYMEKSESFVTRLKNAYEFALKFVEYVDQDGAEKIAHDNFSILEEISKARIIGPQLRDYFNSDFDELRREVFDMVQNEVFSEYRDARFLKELHDDADKWEELKRGEKHIARRLSLELRTTSSSPRTKIAALPQTIKRSIERGETDFGDEDIDALQQAIDHISDHLHTGVRPFRIKLRNLTRTLTEASMADVKELTAEEVTGFREALGYFDDLVLKHGNRA